MHNSPQLCPLAINPVSQTYKSGSCDISTTREASVFMSSSSNEEQWIDVTQLNNFALKLGYSQNQIQMVVNRHGPKMTQNELLSELVKIRGSDKERETCFSTEEYCLRHVVIDGGNVAVSHGNREKISCKGIKICVDWFKNRGHKDITVFTPSWWRDPSPSDLIIKDRHLIDDMNRDILCVSCCDDRAILKYVAQVDGVLVSNDNYSRYVTEDVEYENVVENRLLMYSFVNNRFMPPDDPLGRHGPTLEKFLRRSKSYREESRNYIIRKSDDRLVSKNKKSSSKIKKGRNSDIDQVAVTRTDSSAENMLCQKLKKFSLEKPKLGSNYDKVYSKQLCKQPYYLSASRSTLQSHRKLHRQNYNSDRTLDRKCLWMEHSAEKPLEPSKDSVEKFNQENWFSWMKDNYSNNSILYVRKQKPRELWAPEDSILSEENDDNRIVSTQICQFPDYSILREKLHFHLSAIFPKEQVETVLNIYPHETRPQKLCAAILSLFPNG